MSFKEWLLTRESTSHTRARAAAAKGLMPSATVGSLHGGSTAAPWIVKALKKKKKGKKKLSVKNPQIDSWLKEVEKLKETIDKLKIALKKKALAPKKKVETSKKDKAEDEKESLIPSKKRGLV